MTSHDEVFALVTVDSPHRLDLLHQSRFQQSDFYGSVQGERTNFGMVTPQPQSVPAIHVKGHAHECHERRSCMMI